MSSSSSLFAAAALSLTHESERKKSYENRLALQLESNIEVKEAVRHAYRRAQMQAQERRENAAAAAAGTGGSGRIGSANTQQSNMNTSTQAGEKMIQQQQQQQQQMQQQKEKERLHRQSISSGGGSGLESFSTNDSTPPSSNDATSTSSTSASTNSDPSSSSHRLKTQQSLSLSSGLTIPLSSSTESQFALEYSTSETPGLRYLKQERGKAIAGAAGMREGGGGRSTSKNNAAASSSSAASSTSHDTLTPLLLPTSPFPLTSMLTELEYSRHKTPSDLTSSYIVLYTYLQTYPQMLAQMKFKLMTRWARFSVGVASGVYASIPQVEKLGERMSLAMGQVKEAYNGVRKRRKQLNAAAGGSSSTASVMASMQQGSMNSAATSSSGNNSSTGKNSSSSSVPQPSSTSNNTSFLDSTLTSQDFISYFRWIIPYRTACKDLERFIIQCKWMAYDLNVGGVNHPQGRGGQHPSLTTCSEIVSSFLTMRSNPFIIDRDDELKAITEYATSSANASSSSTSSTNPSNKPSFSSILHESRLRLLRQRRYGLHLPSLLYDELSINQAIINMGTLNLVTPLDYESGHPLLNQLLKLFPTLFEESLKKKASRVRSMNHGGAGSGKTSNSSNTEASVNNTEGSETKSTPTPTGGIDLDRSGGVIYTKHANWLPFLSRLLSTTPRMNKHNLKTRQVFSGINQLDSALQLENSFIDVIHLEFVMTRLKSLASDSHHKLIASLRNDCGSVHTQQQQMNNTTASSLNNNAKMETNLASLRKHQHQIVFMNYTTLSTSTPTAAGASTATPTSNSTDTSSDAPSSGPIPPPQQKSLESELLPALPEECVLGMNVVVPPLPSVAFVSSSNVSSMNIGGVGMTSSQNNTNNTINPKDIPIVTTTTSSGTSSSSATPISLAPSPYSLPPHKLHILYTLRYLRIRTLKDRVLSILNYLRSIERKITLDQYGYSFEDRFQFNSEHIIRTVPHTAPTPMKAMEKLVMNMSATGVGVGGVGGAGNAVSATSGASTSSSGASSSISNQSARASLTLAHSSASSSLTSLPGGPAGFTTRLPRLHTHLSSYLPSEYEKEEAIFMAFQGIERRDDTYRWKVKEKMENNNNNSGSSSNNSSPSSITLDDSEGEIQVDDCCGIPIIYDIALQDFDLLEEELLTLGTWCVREHRARDTSAGAAASGAATQSSTQQPNPTPDLVDRWSLLLDLWESESEFQVTKSRLLDILLELYEHTLSKKRQEELVRRIRELIVLRPYIDLSQPGCQPGHSKYFTHYIALHCKLLHSQIIFYRSILDWQMAHEKSQARRWDAQDWRCFMKSEKQITEANGGGGSEGTKDGNTTNNNKSKAKASPATSRRDTTSQRGISRRRGGESSGEEDDDTETSSDSLSVTVTAPPPRGSLKPPTSSDSANSASNEATNNNSTSSSTSSSTTSDGGRDSLLTQLCSLQVANSLSPFCRIYRMGMLDILPSIEIVLDIMNVLEDTSRVIRQRESITNRSVFDHLILDYSILQHSAYAWSQHMQLKNSTMYDLSPHREILLSLEMSTVLHDPRAAVTAINAYAQQNIDKSNALAKEKEEKEKQQALAQAAKEKANNSKSMQLAISLVDSPSSGGNGESNASSTSSSSTQSNSPSSTSTSLSAPSSTDTNKLSVSYISSRRLKRLSNLVELEDEDQEDEEDEEEDAEDSGDASTEGGGGKKKNLHANSKNKFLTSLQRNAREAAPKSNRSSVESLMKNIVTPSGFAICVEDADSGKGEEKDGTTTTTTTTTTMMLITTTTSTTTSNASNSPSSSSSTISSSSAAAASRTISSSSTSSSAGTSSSHVELVVFAAQEKIRCLICVNLLEALSLTTILLQQTYESHILTQIYRKQAMSIGLVCVRTLLDPYALLYGEQSVEDGMIAAVTSSSNTSSDPIDSSPPKQQSSFLLAIMESEETLPISLKDFTKIDQHLRLDPLLFHGYDQSFLGTSPATTPGYHTHGRVSPGPVSGRVSPGGQTIMTPHLLAGEERDSGFGSGFGGLQSWSARTSMMAFNPTGRQRRFFHRTYGLAAIVAASAAANAVTKSQRSNSTITISSAQATAASTALSAGGRHQKSLSIDLPASNEQIINLSMRRDETATNSVTTATAIPPSPSSPSSSSAVEPFTPDTSSSSTSKSTKNGGGGGGGGKVHRRSVSAGNVSTLVSPVGVQVSLPLPLAGILKPYKLPYTQSSSDGLTIEVLDHDPMSIKAIENERLEKEKGGETVKSPRASSPNGVDPNSSSPIISSPSVTISPNVSILDSQSSSTSAHLARAQHRSLLEAQKSRARDKVRKARLQRVQAEREMAEEERARRDALRSEEPKELCELWLLAFRRIVQAQVAHKHALSVAVEYHDTLAREQEDHALDYLQYTSTFHSSSVGELEAMRNGGGVSAGNAHNLQTGRHVGGGTSVGSTSSGMIREHGSSGGGGVGSVVSIHGRPTSPPSRASISLGVGNAHYLRVGFPPTSAGRSLGTSVLPSGRESMLASPYNMSSGTSPRSNQTRAISPLPYGRSSAAGMYSENGPGMQSHMSGSSGAGGVSGSSGANNTSSLHTAQHEYRRGCFSSRTFLYLDGLKRLRYETFQTRQQFNHAQVGLTLAVAGLAASQEESEMSSSAYGSERLTMRGGNKGSHSFLSQSNTVASTPTHHNTLSSGTSGGRTTMLYLRTKQEQDKLDGASIHIYNLDCMNSLQVYMFIIESVKCMRKMKWIHKRVLGGVEGGNGNMSLSRSIPASVSSSRTKGSTSTAATTAAAIKKSISYQDEVDTISPFTMSQAASGYVSNYSSWHGVVPPYSHTNAAAHQGSHSTSSYTSSKHTSLPTTRPSSKYARIRALPIGGGNSGAANASVAAGKKSDENLASEHDHSHLSSLPTQADELMVEDLFTHVNSVMHDGETGSSSGSGISGGEASRVKFSSSSSSSSGRRSKHSHVKPSSRSSANRSKLASGAVSPKSASATAAGKDGVDAKATATSNGKDSTATSATNSTAAGSSVSGSVSVLLDSDYSSSSSSDSDSGGPGDNGELLDSADEVYLLDSAPALGRVRASTGRRIQVASKTPSAFLYRIPRISGLLSLLQDDRLPHVNIDALKLDLLARQLLLDLIQLCRVMVELGYDGKEDDGGDIDVVDLTNMEEQASAMKHPSITMPQMYESTRWACEEISSSFINGMQQEDSYSGISGSEDSDELLPPRPLSVTQKRRLAVMIQQHVVINPRDVAQAMMSNSAGGTGGVNGGESETNGGGSGAGRNASNQQAASSTPDASSSSSSSSTRSLLSLSRRISGLPDIFWSGLISVLRAKRLVLLNQLRVFVRVVSESSTIGGMNESTQQQNDTARTLLSSSTLSSDHLLRSSFNFSSSSSHLDSSHHSRVEDVLLHLGQDEDADQRKRFSSRSNTLEEHTKQARLSILHAETESALISSSSTMSVLAHPFLPLQCVPTGAAVSSNTAVSSSINSGISSIFSSCSWLLATQSKVYQRYGGLDNTVDEMVSSPVASSTTISSSAASSNVIGATSNNSTNSSSTTSQQNPSSQQPQLESTRTQYTCWEKDIMEWYHVRGESIHAVIPSLCPSAGSVHFSDGASSSSSSTSASPTLFSSLLHLPWSFLPCTHAARARLSKIWRSFESRVHAVAVVRALDHPNEIVGPRERRRMRRAQLKAAREQAAHQEQLTQQQQNLPSATATKEERVISEVQRSTYGREMGVWKRQKEEVGSGGSGNAAVASSTESTDAEKATSSGSTTSATSSSTSTSPTDPSTSPPSSSSSSSATTSHHHHSNSHDSDEDSSLIRHSCHPSLPSSRITPTLDALESTHLKLNLYNTYFEVILVLTRLFDVYSQLKRQRIPYAVVGEELIATGGTWSGGSGGGNSGSGSASGMNTNTSSEDPSLIWCSRLLQNHIESSCSSAQSYHLQSLHEFEKDVLFRIKFMSRQDKKLGGVGIGGSGEGGKLGRNASQVSFSTQHSSSNLALAFPSSTSSSANLATSTSSIPLLTRRQRVESLWKLLSTCVRTQGWLIRYKNSAVNGKNSKVAMNVGGSGAHATSSNTSSSSLEHAYSSYRSHPSLQSHPFSYYTTFTDYALSLTHIEAQECVRYLKTEIDVLLIKAATERYRKENEMVLRKFATSGSTGQGTGVGARSSGVRKDGGGGGTGKSSSLLPVTSSLSPSLSASAEQHEYIERVSPVHLFLLALAPMKLQLHQILDDPAVQAVNSGNGVAGGKGNANESSHQQQQQHTSNSGPYLYPHSHSPSSYFIIGESELHKCLNTFARNILSYNDRSYLHHLQHQLERHSHSSQALNLRERSLVCAQEQLRLNLTQNSIISDINVFDISGGMIQQEYANLTQGLRELKQLIKLRGRQIRKKIEGEYNQAILKLLHQLHRIRKEFRHTKSFLERTVGSNIKRVKDEVMIAFLDGEFSQRSLFQLFQQQRKERRQQERRGGDGGGKKGVEHEEEEEATISKVDPLEQEEDAESIRQENNHIQANLEILKQYNRSDSSGGMNLQINEEHQQNQQPLDSYLTPDFTSSKSRVDRIKSSLLTLHNDFSSRFTSKQHSQDLKITQARGILKQYSQQCEKLANLQYKEKYLIQTLTELRYLLYNSQMECHNFRALMLRLYQEKKSLLIWRTDHIFHYQELKYRWMKYSRLPKSIQNIHDAREKMRKHYIELQRLSELEVVANERSIQDEMRYTEKLAEMEQELVEKRKRKVEVFGQMKMAIAKSLGMVGEGSSVEMDEDGSIPQSSSTHIHPSQQHHTHLWTRCLFHTRVMEEEELCTDLEAENASLRHLIEHKMKTGELEAARVKEELKEVEERTEMEKEKMRRDMTPASSAVTTQLYHSVHGFSAQQSPVPPVPSTLYYFDALNGKQSQSPPESLTSPFTKSIGGAAVNASVASESGIASNRTVSSSLSSAHPTPAQLQAHLHRIAHEFPLSVSSGSRVTISNRENIKNIDSALGMKNTNQAMMEAAGRGRKKGYEKTLTSKQSAAATAMTADAKSEHQHRIGGLVSNLLQDDNNIDEVDEEEQEAEGKNEDENLSPDSTRNNNIPIEDTITFPLLDSLHYHNNNAGEEEEKSSAKSRSSSAGSNSSSQDRSAATMIPRPPSSSATSQSQPPQHKSRIASSILTAAASASSSVEYDESELLDSFSHSQSAQSSGFIGVDLLQWQEEIMRATSRMTKQVKSGHTSGVASSSALHQQHQQQRSSASISSVLPSRFTISHAASSSRESVLGSQTDRPVDPFLSRPSLVSSGAATSRRMAAARMRSSVPSPPSSSIYEEKTKVDPTTSKPTITHPANIRPQPFASPAAARPSRSNNKSNAVAPSTAPSPPLAILSSLGTTGQAVTSQRNLKQ